MRIGILESGLPPERVGGAELQAWALACQLAKNHDVTVFTRCPQGVTKLTETRGDVRIIRSKIWPFPFSYLSHVIGFVRTVMRERNKLDVLVCFRSTPNGLVGVLVRKWFNVPICTCVRGSDFYFVRKRLIGRMLLKYVYARSDSLVVQSQKIAEDVKRFMPSLMPTVIPNGVELDGKVRSGDAVICVGSLTENKGIDILLDAMREFSSEPVCIIGEGKERTRLQEMSNDLRVEFMGQVDPDKVRCIMAERGKVFVLPSVYREGLPNVILQAMSVGMPVIASDLGGVADLLDGGRAGILVRPGDRENLVNALRTMLFDKEAEKKFAAAGSDAVAKYSWGKITALWESHCEGLLE